MFDIYIPETPAIWIDSLEKWWEKVTEEKGKYKCYAIFLVLPTDYSAIAYLKGKDYLNELDIISNKNCLVIVASKEYIKRGGTDKKLVELRRKIHVYADKLHDDEIRPIKVETQGYCKIFARIFKIKYDQFPCMILFQNIDSPRHIIVSLQNISSEKIALRMRNIFTVVDNAVTKNRDPLSAVHDYLLKYKILDKKTSLVNDIREFAGKTLGYAMQAWINSLFKGF
jgi:hypothetical protein